MICDKIQILIDYALRYGLITPEDIYVVRNRFMEVFSLTDWQVSGGISSGGAGIDEILDSLTDYACAEGMIPDTANSRDLFDTRLMGILTPMPHEVNSGFRMRYADSPESATDWYYDLSKRLNYVRAGRIAKDLKWKYASDFGELDITINLSKPEKDPKAIAAAKNAKTVGYPSCLLCKENEGYAGRANHPARGNHRIIPLKLAG
ncbi:MAG: galactose-1-phosphate uridylyltransferase, partial [Ruminococcus sp.]|nr:galactose-1-phosphate uridylyltransferase [Ruminococcus sp.]